VTASPSILSAFADKRLFRDFLGRDQSTWANWKTAISMLYGLPLPNRRRVRELVRTCSGRTLKRLPPDGFRAALFLTGRRSGKSRIASIVAAFEGAIAGNERKLAKGERGVVAVVAPTRRQARVVRDYVRGIFETPLLQQEVANETRDGFELVNGVSIEVLAGDWRTVRNFTLLAVVVDEAAFFGLDEESKVRSDTELIRALKPGLATTNGRLIAISSPYARKGWCWAQYQRCFGDKGNTLVWNAPSRMMNPTLPQSVVDDAIEEDLQAAKSEYLGEFRDDVSEFLPRSLIEGLVVKDRKELLPRSATHYAAFVDLSGGRHDDAALAIGHKEDRKAVVDLLRRYRPPHNPHEVVRLMADEVRRYNLREVTGDQYAAEFVARAFESCGVRYRKAEKPKSPLYLEFLPRACSGEIELPDDAVLVGQLSNLERRTRSGGRDVVDHPPGAHDDVANAVAGLCDLLFKRVIRVGGLRFNEGPHIRRMEHALM